LLKWQGSKPLRILDFDLENRPLSYWFDGNTTAEVTAIAASWLGETYVDCRLLTLEPGSATAMLDWFLDLYNQADMVTGHYIRKHDLPILNAMCLDLGYPPLGSKLASDTQLDLMKRKDLSASQESLAAMFGLPEPKHHMTQQEWRKANRLLPDGMEATRERVTKDVIQHKALRAELITRGFLKAAKVWSP